MAQPKKPLAGTTYQVDGAKQLIKTLRKAGIDFDDLKPVNGDAAEIVGAAAGPAAPRRSGRLASTLRTSATKRAGVIRAGNNRKNNGVPYANPIHWGWVRRGIKPNPFLSRTAKATEPRWLRLYENFTDKVLRKVKGK